LNQLAVTDKTQNSKFHIYMGLTGFDSKVNGHVSMQAQATMALKMVAKNRRRKQLRSCCLIHQVNFALSLTKVSGTRHLS
jgi:hypothetical protein